MAVPISEHIGSSYRTLLPFSSPVFKAIRFREHVNISDHNNYSITPEQFKIIAHGQKDIKLLIKESLLIKHLKYNLNYVDPFTLAGFSFFFVLVELMYV